MIKRFQTGIFGFSGHNGMNTSCQTVRGKFFSGLFFDQQGQKNIDFLKFKTYDQRLIQRRHEEQAQRSSTQC
jgi:hypothetical protein